MQVDIYLTDTETGESKVYHDNYEWQDSEDETWPATAGIIYQYIEGNYACDCNRSVFLYGKDEAKKKPCGDTIKLEKIVDRADGQIVWSEDKQKQEDLQIRLKLQYGMTFLT